ncbi:hypothetical protein FD800_27930 [Klebsiella pneumoniae]|nr:hypothetical protein [Klebsiella pneumoniae]
MFAGKKSAQIREILISESAWEEMTCLFAPSFALFITDVLGIKAFIRYDSNVDTTLSTPVLVPRTF